MNDRVSIGLGLAHDSGFLNAEFWFPAFVECNGEDSNCCRVRRSCWLQHDMMTESRLIDNWSSDRTCSGLFFQIEICRTTEKFHNLKELL